MRLERGVIGYMIFVAKTILNISLGSEILSELFKVRVLKGQNVGAEMMEEDECSA